MEREGRNSESYQKYLEGYLRLENEFVEPPKVSLQLVSQSPLGDDKLGVRDIAATTAFQCYAPGIAKLKDRSNDPKAQAVADSTLDAGHHTTRMHSNLTFRIEGATRSVTHDIFHSHPFYNSEQQSQRYVEAKEGNYLIPKNLTEQQQQVYLKAASFSNKAYFELLKILHPEVNQRIKRMYPVEGWRNAKTTERLNSKIAKTSQEVARYVLPIAQKTIYYHTLNEMQLLRMFRACETQNFSKEAKYILARMICEVNNYDPQINYELNPPLIGVPINNFKEEFIYEQKQEFDSTLKNKQTLLRSIPENARSILADTVRNVLGIPSTQMSDKMALDNLLNPGKNKLLADVYETGMLDPMTSSLRQINLTFATRLSHTADSQRQRQRRTPGATPSIEALYDGRIDYSTPLVIRDNPALKDCYDEIMCKIYENIERAISAGISKEYALLLLPNAHNVRVVESGDLFDWIHRWKQRLCYLAQEEIFFISVEQVQQVLKELPDAQPIFLAPCGIRQKAIARPRCPEGERWCGKPVYNWQIEKYKKERLI
ncbi:MAG: FAD-dependent thymidylate synthase [bacterium]|nr:FAD-dependent thymidylate synthase [bacterium]